MAKSHKPTANAIAFEKEVKRLQRLVKIAENKGITFLTSPIPERPKRITQKKLDLIHSITRSDVESKGYSIDTETGELQNYVPPTKSKQRRGKLPERISSQGEFVKTQILKEPTGRRTYSDSKKRLTAEELHEIRSKAAKKAAQTRKAREATDVEYAKRMQEQRRKALEKAREARRKWEQENPDEARKRRSEAAKKAAETRRIREQEDTEYKKRINEIRRINLEKAREVKRKKKTEQFFEEASPIPEEAPPIPEEVKYSSDLDIRPERKFETLYNVRDILVSAQNKNIANFLLDLMIEEMDSIGEEALGERLARSSEQSIEMANGAAYDSEAEEVANCAYSLACLILDNNVSPIIQETIEELAYEDRPYIPRGWR